MAARIAQRRQASFERRRSGGGDETAGGDHREEAAGQINPALVAQIESALRHAKQEQDHQQQDQGSEADGGHKIVFGIGSQRNAFSAGTCAEWLDDHAGRALTMAIATALMQPWKAVGSTTSHADEMCFIRALAEHGSEEAVLGLLKGVAFETSGYGAGNAGLLDEMAACVWRTALTLRTGHVDSAASSAPQIDILAQQVAGGEAPGSSTSYERNAF